VATLAHELHIRKDHLPGVSSWPQPCAECVQTGGRLLHRRKCLGQRSSSVAPLGEPVRNSPVLGPAPVREFLVSASIAFVIRLNQRPQVVCNPVDA